MNDNASLALGGSRSALGGLPQRLVQDGLVDEPTMQSALQNARDRKGGFVTQLIGMGAARWLGITSTSSPALRWCLTS